MKNFPKQWYTFKAIIKQELNYEEVLSKAGLIQNIGDINRFAARFRVAKSLKPIELEGFTKLISQGYSSLFRFFLIFTAFETYCNLFTRSRRYQFALEATEPKKIIDFKNQLSKIDNDKKIFMFISEKATDKELKNSIENYTINNDYNIFILASGFRHIFAHGFLTPSSWGNNPIKMIKICNIIFDFLIDFIENDFTKRVDKMKSLSGTKIK